jgi:hypothetical protein
LKLLLIESERKLKLGYLEDEEVRRNLDEAKELLDHKDQMRDKSVEEILSEM